MDTSINAAAHYKRLARLAQVQGVVADLAQAAPVKQRDGAVLMLQRIDELLAEVTCLHRKYRDATALFADRINARLQAIALELRALNRVTNGHTVTCWFEATDLVQRRAAHLGARRHAGRCSQQGCRYLLPLAARRWGNSPTLRGHS